MAIRLISQLTQWLAGEKLTAQDLNDTFLAVNRFYSDGLSKSQTTYDADTFAGQNDATTKKTKLFQQFQPSKDSIKSIALFKSATSDTPFSNSDGGGLTYSENDAYGYAQDNGVSGGKRSVQIYAGQGANVNITLSKVMTGLVIGRTYTITSNSMQTSNAYAATLSVRIDGNALANYTLNSQNVNVPVSTTFTATATSHTLQFYLVPQYSTSIWGSFTLDTINVSASVNTIASNLLLDIYADNGSNAPSSTSLGTITISSATYNALTANAEATFNFSTAIYNINPANKYWLGISLATPTSNAGNLPTFKKGASITTLGLFKYWNTTDGYQTEAGNLYLKVLESRLNKAQVYTTE